MQKENFDAKGELLHTIWVRIKLIHYRRLKFLRDAKGDLCIPFGNELN